MAVRRVTTRLAIEGEAEYQQKVQRISSELKTLESNLKLVSTRYAENANSLEALAAKSAALAEKQAVQAQKVEVLTAAYDNAKGSVQAYEERKAKLTSQIEENEQALEKLKNTQGDTTEEEKRLTDETARLKNEIEENNARLTAAERGVNEWQNKLNYAEIQLEETNREIRANDQYLDEARRSTEQTASSIDKFGNKVDDAGDSLSELNSVLTAAGVIGALKKLADAMVACCEASIEFESGMTGVAKTTDLTTQELADMGDAIKALSREIPQTTTELAAIAENAGQLGIEKESILSFTRVMADLGVATNLTGEQAAQAFAKFANITGMAQSDFDRLGAAVVDLGNNLATTEADIANMALRLAAAGTQAGMTQGEILGLAGALSSVGMEAQAGGSAFSKAINKMTVAVETGSDDLTDFASVAGMTAHEFARAYREDAAGALVTFISGLDNLDAHGKSAVLLLEELGLTETRLRDSLTRAANASDLFVDSVARGNQAWAENTALATEAELRYSTTESKLLMLANAFNNCKIAVGDQLNPALNVLVDIGTELLWWVEDFLNDTTLVVPILTGVGVALGTLAVSLTAYTVIVPLATKVTAAFSAALLAHPIFGVIAAVTGLVTVMGLLVASYDDGIVKAKDMTQASRAAADAFESIDENARKNAQSVEATAIAAGRFCDQLDALNKKAAETGLNSAELDVYRGIVGELNQLIPGLNLTINEQTGIMDGNTDAVRRNINAWRDQAILEGQMSALTAKYSELGAVQLELAQNSVIAAAAERDLQVAIGAQEDALNRINEIMAETTEATNELSTEHGNATAPAGELTQEYRNLMDSLYELADGVYKAEKQLEEANKAIEITEETLEGLSGELEIAEAALGLLDSAMADATETIDGWTDAELHSQEVRQEAISQMAVLQEAYNETFEAARASIEKQIGLFDTFDFQVEMSTTSMVQTWQTQAENVRLYNENLAFASRYLSSGLIEAWSDGSTESAGYIEAFSGELRKLIEKHGEESEEVQTFVDDFNAAYIETRVARDEFAENVADMSTNFTNSMDEIQAKLDETVAAMSQADKATVSANETINGLVNTFNARMGEMYASGVSAGAAFMAGYNSQMAIRSPSRKAEEAADFTMQGFEKRFDRGVEELNEAGKEMAHALAEGYSEVERNEALAAAPIYNASTYNNRQTVSNRAEIRIQVQSMGETERKALINEIDKYFGGRTTVAVIAGSDS